MDRLLCCADFHRDRDVYCQFAWEPQGDFPVSPEVYEVADPWMCDYRGTASSKKAIMAKALAKMEMKTGLLWGCLI